jgi:predicted transcriptional regulator
MVGPSNVIIGMRYRSRTEIITQILEIANDCSSSFGNGGVTKTRIMYKAYLGYNQSNEYLTLLTESDLLRYDGQKHTFKTTEKGLRFLKAYAQIDQLMKPQEI